MRRITRLCPALLLILSCLPGALPAAEYLLSAPPREDAEAAHRIYDPIARFLTEQTGDRFRYVFPGSWLAYQSALADDRYDQVFDGPHFVAWRMARHGHEPLVRIPGQLKFTVIARNDSGLTRIEDLSGNRVCGHPPPHLATLGLMARLDNPARQPRIKEAPTFRKQFDALLAGKCEAMVLPNRLLKKFLTSETPVHVIGSLQPVAHQAITASSRIPPDLRARIRELLLSREGQEAMAELRQRYARGKELVAAHPQDYDQSTARLLEPVWFFSSSNPKHAGKLRGAGSPAN
ncbi:MAG: hypothetical protein D6717_03830 [Gammaproteobacteria bacterium]|nr:MAG: hypothetical protein D6717_03830 [Gammaproteobacteria bacterium]